MEKEKNIDLDEEEKGGVQGEEADDDTEKDDEFEYDDDGNIIIPDVIEDEDQDEDGDDDAADTDDDTDDEDEGEGGSDDEDKETPKPAAEPEGKDEKDAQIEALQKKLEAQGKEYEALKAQSADTLAKLGVKSENVLEGSKKWLPSRTICRLTNIGRKRQRANVMTLQENSCNRQNSRRKCCLTLQRFSASSPKPEG